MSSNLETSSYLTAMVAFAPGAVGGVCNVVVGYPIDLVKVRMQTMMGKASVVSSSSSSTATVVSTSASSAVTASAAASPSVSTASAATIVARNNHTLAAPPAMMRPAVATAARDGGGVGTFTLLRSIFVQEGMRGLYHGVTAPLLAVTPAFAVSFWSYDFAKTMLSKMTSSKKGDSSTAEEHPTPFHCFLAGGFSGVPMAFVIAPSDRIKCLMQIQSQQRAGVATSTAAAGMKKGAGIIDCLHYVYSQGGIRSVYRGLFATMLRDVPGNAAYFGGYELTRRQLSRLFGVDSQQQQQRRSKLSIGITFIAGGMAGVSNWIVAIPFDVVKSRYQTASPGQYKNLYDVYTQLMMREGPSALFRGLAPALIRAFPANAACLLGVETARSVLQIHS